MTLGSDLLRMGAIGVGQGLVSNLLDQSKVRLGEPVVIIRLEEYEQLKKDLEYANGLILKLKQKKRIHGRRSI